MDSQHPSPNVKNFPLFEPQIWPEIITSRDADGTCFKGSRTLCREIIFGIFGANFGQKRSHHVMDASCRVYFNFSATTPVVYKKPPPMGPKNFIHHWRWEAGLKVSVAIFPSSGGGV